MNKNILIASAIAAGALSLYYAYKRKKESYRQLVAPTPAEYSRHLTRVFAKAKHN